MKFIIKPVLLAGLALACMGTAHAGDVEGKDLLAKERFQIRGRLIQVRPDMDASVNIGGNIKGDNGVSPEIDFTYLLSNHWAVELIAATTRHQLTHSSGADLGKAWALPPTLTLQYRITPDQAFSPYVGAGVNYTMFYAEKTGAGFDDLDVGNGVGWALQAGADYWLNDHWGVNLDVKKIFVNVDATLNQGGIRAGVDVDPWVIGAGMSYRF